MTRHLSIYLDCLRLGAALVVFASHYGLYILADNALPLQAYGHGAVIVFFVLSGYVIAYSAERKNATFDDYLLSRMSRLLSVVVPALALTVLLDTIGRGMAPEVYRAAFNVQWDQPVLRLLMSLTFMTQSWNYKVVAFSNLPYWSIAYEFWYYMLFGCLHYLNGRTRLLGAAAVALVVGPKILMLAPIWFLGVMAWRWRGRLSPGSSWRLFLSTLCGLAVLELAGGRALFPIVSGAWWPPSCSPYDYLLGLLIAANIYGAAGCRSLPLVDSIERPIRFGAGHTFSIYLYHMPLMLFLTALAPWGAGSPWGLVLLPATTIALVLLLGRWTEHRRDTVRAMLAATLHALRGRLPARSREIAPP